jgi:16S rRNA (uracil1498-N3)-methyltransferase
MPVERFYSAESLEQGSKVTFEGAEFHHLKHVIRSKEGDLVELVNGKGDLASVRIESLGKKRASLLVESARSSKRSSFSLILIQAIPRPSRLDTILEKGTELGVTEFWLFPGERSERKIAQTQLPRLHSVTVAALKQCGRLFLPTMQIIPSVLKWERVPENCWYGDFSSDSKPLRPASQSAIVIGPESGLTSKEVEYLKALGAKPASLHPNTLRTDTAAICALSLLSQSVT